LKNNLVEIGYNVETKLPIKINVAKLISGRGLVQANSGGGKSYLLRKILEATNKSVQQIIIDLEGTYTTLREKFDYILIGKKEDGADIQISVKLAETLAIKLLELGTSAIIDLYEMHKSDRIRFVKLFLDSLVNAPKELWHECLVVVDEGHTFGPEKGHGEADSLQSMIDLATRGRKRGFALLVATQRPSKLSKDISAELNTKFVGRCTLDIDQKRAGDDLGFFEKTQRLQLRKLDNEFYAFGPAISDDVIKIKSFEVKTTHESSLFKKQKLKPKPTEKIKNVLAKLENLPQEAEHELKTKEELQIKVRELVKEVRQLQTNKPVVDPNTITVEKKLAYSRGYTEGEKHWKSELERLQILHDKLLTASEDIVGQRNALSEIIKQTSNSTNDFINKLKATAKLYPQIKEIQMENFQFRARPNPIQKPDIKMETTTKITPQPTQKWEIRDNSLDSPDSEKPKGGSFRMLQAAARFYPESITKSRMALMARLSPTSGTTSNYISELRTRGLIEDKNGDFVATPLGYDMVGNTDSLPRTNDEMLNMWLQYIKGKTKDMLKVLAEVHPNDLSKEELAERVGMAMSGTFSNYISTLRTNGLIIDTTRGFKASDDLFPESI